METEHKFIKIETDYTGSAEFTSLATYILNKYLSNNLSAKKLKKMKTITFDWNHSKKGNQTGSVSFNQVVNYLSENRNFSNEIFNLPDFKSPMFDNSIEINLPQPIMSLDGKFEAVKFRLPLDLGKVPPLSPSILKEGFATNDLLLHVLGNISDLRESLIDQSQNAIHLRGGWFLNFRMMLNECVSAVDMQLNKIYLLAEYRGEELGLTFDKEILGDRFGRRIMDKLSWVGATKGLHLDNAKLETENFRKLKDLRNHLNHFDPPCFCCSVEELCEWLNMVQDVGRLIWKIRSKFDAQLNAPLVRLILQPRVVFCPKYGKERRPSNEDGTEGYKSSIWK